MRGTSWWVSVGMVLCARAAASAPTVSPEFQVGEPAGRPSSSARNPEVACGPTQCFAVWTDGSIYGARVTRSGTVLDPVAIPIAAAVPNYRDSIGVAAFGSSEYLVAYGDPYNGKVGLVRVSAADGSLITSAPVMLGVAWARWPRVACDANRCLVVWDQTTNNGNTNVAMGTRIEAGVVLDGSTGTTIVPYLIPSSRVAVAAGAGQFFVAGHYGYGGRLDSATGTALGTVQFANRLAADNPPSITFDGANFFITWSGATMTTYSWLYGARVRASDGVLLDADDDFNNIAGSLRLTPGSGRHAFSPSSHFDGSKLVALWREYPNTILGARFEPATGNRTDGTDGTSAEFSVAQLATSSTSTTDRPFAVAYDAAGGLLLGQDEAMDACGVYGQPLSIVNGRPSAAARFDIAGRSDDQSKPIVGSNGTDFLVAWNDARTAGSRTDLYVARVRANDATVLDPQGTLIATGTTGPASVASDGANYLVAFEKNAGIYAQRIDATSGAPIGSATFLEAGRTVGAGSDATQYLVVYGPATDYGLMHARRIRPDGTVVDTSPILMDSRNPTPPILVTADTTPTPDYRSFLIQFPLGSQTLEYAIIRSKLGSRISPATLWINATGIAAGGLTTDGTDFLIGYLDASNGYVHSARMRPLDGLLLSNVTITGTASTRRAAASGFDGRSQMFVYSTGYNSGGSFESVAAARATVMGTPIDQDIPVQDPKAPDGQLSLGSNRLGRSIVLYANDFKLRTEVGRRLRARMIDNDWDPDAGTDGGGFDGGIEAGAPDAASEGGTETDGSPPDVSVEAGTGGDDAAVGPGPDAGTPDVADAAVGPGPDAGTPDVADAAVGPADAGTPDVADATPGTTDGSSVAPDVIDSSDAQAATPDSSAPVADATSPASDTGTGAETAAEDVAVTPTDGATPADGQAPGAVGSGEQPAGEETGCACSVPTGRSSNGWSFALLGAAMLAFVRRSARRR